MADFLKKLAALLIAAFGALFLLCYFDTDCKVLRWVYKQVSTVRTLVNRLLKSDEAV